MKYLKALSLQNMNPRVIGYYFEEITYCPIIKFLLTLVSSGTRCCSTSADRFTYMITNLVIIYLQLNVHIKHSGL